MSGSGFPSGPWLESEEFKGSQEAVLFEGGVHQGSTQANCLEVVEHKHWWASEEALSVLGEGVYKALGALSVQGFFNLVPAIVWQDAEDPDIGGVRSQVFKGSEDPEKEKYELPFLEKGERVVWILQPRFLAKNGDYEQNFDTEKATKQELIVPKNRAR